MASGKNPRMDRRSSSSYCSTVTLVVFVALCLVGVWMMTSSAVVPIDVSTPDNKSDGKEPFTLTDKSFEDSSGDVQEEVTKSDIRTSVKDAEGETNAEASQELSLTEKQYGSREQSLTEKQNESQTEETRETQEANTSKENDDAKNASDEASHTYSDTNGTEEGADANKDSGQGDGQSKPVKQNLEETRETEQSSNESANNMQEQSDKEAKSDGGEKVDVQEENSQAGIQEKVDKKAEEQVEEKAEEKQGSEIETGSEENKTGDKTKDQSLNEVFPDGAQSDILNETNPQNGAFSTQATESKNEKEAQKSLSSGQTVGYSWKLCNVTAGADYIPCLDNEGAIRKLRSTKHYEHRERHCPEEGPACLVPLPEGYRQPIKWPQSRDKIWYFNVPHTKLAEVKGHQNWVKVTGEYLTFPGGGTQFKHGALHYIDFIQESFPDVAWGKRSRVILDVGCGVASFGGFLFDRDVLAMSFAPKDEHEAQVQFALERGIPAISAVMGTKRLPFPSKVFDIVHCARCRVPWHIEGGTLLLELNRLLRPGGFFVWSATPVYQKLPEDVEIWKAMSNLTQSMCWELLVVKKDKVNGVGVAIFRKPSSNECYESRKENNPPLCQESDDPDAAWNVPLQACMHRVPEDPTKRGSQWPEQWPKRLEAVPYWLNSSQVGVYGKAAPEDFMADYQHWQHVVSKSYLNGMGINWSNVRNVMDMRAIYGGFAAALRDINVWVMNIVSINSPDTLPIIYERGLFGMYHDWCESFSSYPRSYDLLHADHLFSKTKKRCKLLPVMAEVDRLLRPGGKLIVRDKVETINEVESMARSLQWEIRLTYSKENEGLLCVQKTAWRPREVEGDASSLA